MKSFVLEKTIKRSAVRCILLSSGLKRVLSSMSCQKNHVIWKSGHVEAFLHPSPWTPAATIVTHRSPNCLFHLPESLFLSLLLGARAVGGLLCDRLAVQRCALVYRPDREDNTPAKLLLLPLHGLEDTWRPHLAPQEDFQPCDPGYITSKSGPRWTSLRLEAIKNKIRAKLPFPDAPPDYTFHGEATHACLFSRIVRGEETQWRVWEDDGHIAFLTPFPNSPGLTVVIPRKPLPSDILRLEEGDYTKLLLATRKVARLLEEALGARRVGLIFEGFEIDYAHAKLIPLVSSPGNMTGSDVCLVPEVYEVYPGFVSSVDGPPASPEQLRQMQAKITGINV